MKVKNLIKELQKFNENYDIQIFGQLTNSMMEVQDAMNSQGESLFIKSLWGDCEVNVSEDSSCEVCTLQFYDNLEIDE